MKDPRDFFREKKVLITGHTGFKGGWLAEILIGAGAKVSGIALEPQSKPALFDLLRLEERMKSYIADIRDLEKVRSIVADDKPEVIFHLAAQPIVQESFSDPIGTIETNVMGTANILHAAKEVGSAKAIVVVTTDKVYENKEKAELFSEGDPLGGHDPYSASKAAADHIAHAYTQSFFHPGSFGNTHRTLVAVARAGNVIGGGDWARHRLLPDIVRGIYKRDGKILIRNPESIRPWQHVLEPLAGYLLLAKRLSEGATDLVGPWNFGPDEKSFISVAMLAQEAVSFLGRGTIAIHSDALGREDAVLKLDISKARSLLDWKPKFSIEDAIRLTLDWYKNYYEGGGSVISYTDSQIASYFDFHADPPHFA